MEQRDAAPPADWREQLAAMRTERDAALEQQAATLEILQAINASSGHLTPVFDTILEKAAHLCGASFGELHLFDGKAFRAGAFLGVPAALTAFRKQTTPPPIPGSIAGDMLAGANVLHVADVRDHELFRNREPSRVALVDLGGARTVLAVALRKDATLLGFIGIFRREVKPYSERQIALLQSFAAQAVIAMENARLINEQREALEQQRASAEILSVIGTSVDDARPVFDKILESCKQLVGGDELNVVVVDEKGMLQQAAYKGSFHDAMLATFPGRAIALQHRASRLVR